MPVRVEVPTGREVWEHVKKWEALPEGERPKLPVRVHEPTAQVWIPLTPYQVREVPRDDTPQPGLRLVPLPVPLPVPVGEGWRRPVDREEALAADWDDVRGRSIGGERIGWLDARGGAVGVALVDNYNDPNEPGTHVPADAHGRIWVDPLPPEPPDGYVVTYDAAVMKRARLGPTCWMRGGSWSDPCVGFAFTDDTLAEGRHAVPASCVPLPPEPETPETEWVPKVGDEVLVAATYCGNDSDGHVILSHLRPAPLRPVRGSDG